MNFLIKISSKYVSRFMLHIWITRPVSQSMDSNIEWLYLVRFFLVLWEPVLTFDCPEDFCAVIIFPVCTTMIQRIIRLIKFQISARRRFSFFYRPVERMSIFSDIVAITIWIWRRSSRNHVGVLVIQVLLNALGRRFFSVTRKRLLIFLGISMVKLVIWHLYFVIPFLQLVHVHVLNR